VQLGNSHSPPGTSTPDPAAKPPAASGMVPLPLPNGGAGDNKPEASKKGVWIIIALIAVVACVGLLYAGVLSLPAAVAGPVNAALSKIPGSSKAASTNSSGLSGMQQKIAHAPYNAIQSARQALAVASNHVQETTAAIAAHRLGGGTGVVAAASAKKTPVTPPSAFATISSKGTTAVTWPEVRVTGVVGSADGHHFARVNGRLLVVGERVDGMTVGAITKRGVTLKMGEEEREYFVSSHK
jgi:hypothetical protein